jgi:hypothetical protein
MKHLGVLPSTSERPQRIQCVFQVIFFFAGSLKARDFSSTLYHSLFSFQDSLGENAFGGFLNGGSVQSSPIGPTQARGRCRIHMKLQIEGKT